VPLTIRRIQRHAELVDALRFSERLYRDHADWARRPARLWALRLRPFLRSERVVFFAAYQDAEVVGTLSVQRDNETAWFGHVQAIDAPGVLSSLWEAVEAQALSWGASDLRGPRDLSRFEYVGLTVDGHERMAPLLQDHHGPWLAPALEALGLQRDHDVLAYEIRLFEEDGRERAIPDVLRRKADAVRLPNLEVRSARWRSVRADLDAVHEVLNESYQTVPEVQPMPRASFMVLGRAFLAATDPELVQLAFVDGRPAAFCVVLPELHEALLRPTGWRRHLPGPWRHLPSRRRIHSVAFKLIGVRTDLRGSGLHAKLIEAVVHGARRAGYDRIDGSVIDERNKPMRAVVEGAGMKVYRRYRFYRKPLATPTG